MPPAITESILDSVKKNLGLGAEYDVFDSDLVMHINSVLFTLNQLGVGHNGFAITGPEEEWSAFLGDESRFNAAKSYVFLKVRLLFDPPASSFAIASMEKLAAEYEWRLNVEAENFNPVTTRTL
jgi:hypothetical protein